MKLKTFISLFILLPWLLTISADCQEPAKGDLMHATVFKQGGEGYHTTRIPSIVESPDGTLIAFAEGRRDNRSDPGGGHIDLVYKLSHDGGQTWSSLLILEKSQEGWSASNPTAIAQKSQGRILILYDVWKPGRGQNQGNCRPGEMDNQIWIRSSDDNGKTWSDARDITRQVRDFDRKGFATLGPGHGIETSSGRLVVPVNEPGELNGVSVRSMSLAVFSDDGGQNWKRGDQIKASTNENQIVEIDNGRLMIDARQSERIDTRWMAISEDKGQTWSKPVAGQVCPAICAGIISYPGRKNTNLLVWSGLRGPGRTNLIIRLSSDQGQSFPAELLIGEGPSAYSDITLMEKGAVGILWENGKENPYESIKFTRVPKNVIKKLSIASQSKNPK